MFFFLTYLGRILGVLVALVAAVTACHAAMCKLLAGPTAGAQSYARRFDSSVALEPTGESTGGETVRLDEGWVQLSDSPNLFQ